MAAPVALIDPFDRRVKDLRISITDRCNFRCTYCMPAEGMQWLPREELLTYEEQARIARVCVERFGFGDPHHRRGADAARPSPPTDRHALAPRGRHRAHPQRGGAARDVARPPRRPP